MFTSAASGRKSNPTLRIPATSRRSAAPATVSKFPNEAKVKNRIFFKLLAAFLIVIAATALTLDVMLGSAWEASLRAQIERDLTQKTLLFAHRVETDRTRSITEITAEEAQAAGARATVIDASGKVLADSESNPATMENHAGRPEFVAALAGKTGSN